MFAVVADVLLIKQETILDKMKTKLIFLFFVLVLTVTLITACSRVNPQPSGLPIDIGTPSESIESTEPLGLPIDIGTPDITGTMVTGLENLPIDIGMP